MFSKWREGLRLEYLAPLMILAACLVWFVAPPAHLDSARPGYHSMEGAGEEQPPPPPPHRGRHGEHGREGARRHGPPPGVPPTVLFLVGAGLGYLVGRSRRFGPPHRRHHCCNKPNPEG